MRGFIRIFCAAAGLSACIASATYAGAADQVRAAPAPVRLTLAGDLSPQPASTYLDGIPFSAAFIGPYGPVAASGIALKRLNLGASYGPPGPDAYDLRDFAASVSLSPELALNLGYKLDDAGRFVRYDFTGAAFDGLFLSASAFGMNGTPFDSRAAFVGASWLAADNVRVQLGEASYAPDRNATVFDTFAGFGRPVGTLLDFGARTANSLMAGVSWDFARWGGLDVGASHTGGHDALLADTFDTTALNVSARFKFGEGWVTTASYGEALTKLDLKPSALSIASSGELHRTGYAVAVAKHGVFGDDALGLSVSQPMSPDAGAFATVAGGQAAPIFIGRDHLLDDLKPETDIEVGYVTTFLDGSLALQTNAAYQMNFAGQGGTNALSLLSRAKIKF